MDFTLRIWRQRSRGEKGRLVTYSIRDVSPSLSFLEMIDKLNLDLIAKGDDPVAFDHDCREGICGSCGLVINGQAHGPDPGTTTCELHMRRFQHGQTIVVEPWRARAFPVVRDLMVDRSAFDRIIMAGGYVTVRTGSAPEANSTPITRENVESAFDSATCIGCGACVATCKNASAHLFVGAKITQLSLLPQGQPERRSRALSMVMAMDREGFGNCTNESECQTACPKSITVCNIARMRREYMRAGVMPTGRCPSIGS